MHRHALFVARRRAIRYRLTAQALDCAVRLQLGFVAQIPVAIPLRDRGKVEQRCLQHVGLLLAGRAVAHSLARDGQEWEGNDALR